MKKLLSVVAVAACSMGLSAGAFAVKPAPASEPGSAPAKIAGEAKPAAAEEPATDAKPIPMHVRADAIDTAARTFTLKRKDGVEVKHVITATTEIRQGSVAAKLEDIKVGDYVSGLRKKVSATEYTEVKITKFGAKEAP